MDTELATVGKSNAYSLVQAAIEKGMGPAELKELLAMVAAEKQRQAAEEFAAAITGFQSGCPVVTKQREVKKDSRTLYTFASFDDVMRIAAPLLAKWHIVPTFTTEQTEGGLKATCRIRVGIHCEETSVSIPIPSATGLVNAVQMVGQALTYVKRYALCAALNIVVTDEDQDGVNCLVSVSPEQTKEIEGLIEAKRVDLTRFLDFVRTRAPGVKEIKDIPQKDYEVVIDMLRRRGAK